MRIGIGIGEIGAAPADIDGLIAQAKRAEADGFTSAWMAQIMGVDAMTALALCGRETTRIELGTAVVPTYPRHPIIMAQQALTTQAACKGRFALGVGLSHQMVIEGMYGLSWAKPYSHMKEYLSVLAPLLRDNSVAFSGKEYNANITLNPPAKSCPLLVAALAPKMLALAGSVTDGTVTWMTGPKTIESHILPSLREAASKAGKPAPRVVVGLPVAVTTDVAAAKESASRVFQIYGYLPSYRSMLDREGVEGPADVAIIGDESSVVAQIRHLADIGVTDFLAAPFPVGADPKASAEGTREVLKKLLRA